MGASVTFLNTLLCEHVVPGLGNKNTLVNVFAGDVVVQTYPAKLLFGFYAEYVPHVSSARMRIEIRIDRMVFGHIDAEFADTAIGLPGAVAIPVIEIGADKDMELSFVALIEGRRPQTILKKRIYVATPGA